MIEQRHFNDRDLREAEDWIAHPIGTGHARTVEFDLFVQCATDGLYDASFDLIPQGIGIHHQPTIVSAGHAAHRDFAGDAVRFDLHRHGDIVFRLFVAHVGDTASGPRPSARPRAPPPTPPPPCPFDPRPR